MPDDVPSVPDLTDELLLHQIFGDPVARDAITRAREEIIRLRAELARTHEHLTEEERERLRKVTAQARRLFHHYHHSDQPAVAFDFGTLVQALEGLEVAWSTPPAVPCVRHAGGCSWLVTPRPDWVFKE